MASLHAASVAGATEDAVLASTSSPVPIPSASVSNDTGETDDGPSAPRHNPHLLRYWSSAASASPQTLPRRRASRPSRAAAGGIPRSSHIVPFCLPALPRKTTSLAGTLGRTHRSYRRESGACLSLALAHPQRLSLQKKRCWRANKFGQPSTSQPIKVKLPKRRSRPRAHGSFSCRPTAPTSIQSKWPSQNSKPICVPGPSGPSMLSGRPSDTSAISSSHPNAKTNSKPPDMDSAEHPPL